MNKFGLISLGFAAMLLGSSATFAADAIKGDLPAVSAVNGKIELLGGWSSITPLADSAAFQGGASISVPLGERFGAQFDVADVNKFNDNMLGATLHFFTRNPDSYLFGAVGGIAKTNNATVSYFGPEAELYMDNVTIEAAGGWMHLDVLGVQSDKLFAIGDLGFYATENLRFTVGASSIAEFEAAHIGAEYQMEDMPVSLTANARIGESDFKEATVGVKLYFGGEGNKSLIRRHREDDPRNRSLDIFNSAGTAFGSAGGMPVVDPCDLGAPAPGSSESEAVCSGEGCCG